MLGDVERIEVAIDDEIDSAVVRVHGLGRTAQAIILPAGIYRPDKRSLAPADVHDSVRTAALAAAEQLQAQAAA